MSKKKKDSMAEDIKTLTKAGVGLGIGAKVVAKVGGSNIPLTTFARHMPMMANIRAAHHVVKGLRKLQPPKYKKKRKR